MIKLSKYICLLLALVLIVPSCDDGFAELNTDPGAAGSIDPNFQMSWIQLRTSGGRYENWRAGLIYSSMMIQHMAAVCGYWTGDKYTWNSGYSSSLFDRAYGEQVKDIVALQTSLEANGGSAEMKAIADVWYVVIFHRLTDLHGDIPYSEAGQGFLTGVTAPAYDAQSDIYADMLAKLESASNALSSGGSAYGASDYIYGGDVDSWKRFANSLMLRLGMRMSKVDPANAEAWVKKAIAGGVMSGVEHNAFIEHAAGPEGINRNGIGEVLDKANGFGDDCPRISQRFMNLMTSTNDPRLPLIAETGNDGEFRGLPNGLDADLLSANPTGMVIDTFSRVNANIVKVSSPMFFMTYAETEFLLAEASMRGWNTGSAEEHYNNGVRAAMQLFEHYPESDKVVDADIDAYLAANPFDAANGMEMIGTQFWMATFLNEYEAYANWRRTGFPTLTPVDYPGNESGGQIPRRLRYSDSEYGTNTDNINAAVARQGPDQFTTRIWWDKE